MLLEAKNVHYQMTNDTYVPWQRPEEEVTIWKYVSKGKKGSAIGVSKCFMAKAVLEEWVSDRPYTDYKLVRIERNGCDCLCSVPFLEGYIQKGTLWLRERDDEKALELFRQNAQKRIEELEKLIEGRKRFLKDAHIE